MRTVKNYEQLLEYAYDCLDSTKEAELLELDGKFDYSITVSGQNWDQYIDWRLAKLITQIQNSINRAFKEANVKLSKDDLQKTTVKFKVSEGSSLVEINCGDLFKVVAEHMTGGQLTAVVITAILVTGGLLTVKRLAARQEKAEDEKTKRELGKVIERVASYEKPMRGLVSRLETEDTVAISPNEETFTKSELRLEYPGKGKYKAINVYVDGVYTIIGLKLDQGIISVEQDGRKLECQSSLSPDEIEEFISPVANAITNEQGFDLQLRITAEYYKGSKQLKKEIIYGIGEPRKGSKTLEELLS